MYCNIINNTFPLQVPANVLNHVSVCLCVLLNLVDQVESEIVQLFVFRKVYSFSVCTIVFYERRIC